MMHGHEKSDSAIVAVKQRAFIWGISDDKIATLRERRDSLRQMTRVSGFAEVDDLSWLPLGRGVPAMCDYSLHLVASRPAKVEDRLVTTKFNNSITRGLAAIGERHVAVCLLPGTEIAFDENVECEPSFGAGILPKRKIGQRLARFRQINMDNAVAHHDALEFPDGQVVLLTRLCEGQRATVLQLPAVAHPTAVKELTRPEVREPSLSN
jgi:hypothetical protein